MKIQQIEGYEDYFVCDSGINNKTVLSKRNTRNRKKGTLIWLKPTIDSGGYQTVGLYDENGKRTTYRLHVLIAQAFIPNPEGKSCIDHINTDRADNRIENLRWVTHQENMNNPITSKRNSEAHKGKYVGEKSPCWGKHPTEEARRKMSEAQPKKAVIQYTLNGEFVAKYSSTKDAERQTGVNSGNISLCCQGKRPTAGGYKWAYLD